MKVSGKNKTIDLQAVKTFFDPNPGEKLFGGARSMFITPAIPAAVKKAADELDGKTMSLFDAAAKIQSAAEGRGEVVVMDNWIALYSMPQNSPSALKYSLHVWRVIKYR
jgi:hypothetical protein